MLRQSAEYLVDPRRVEAVDVHPGESLTSLEGVVWVTSSRDGRDVILGPGDRIQFDKRARAVVGGLAGRSVKVRLDAPTRH